MRGQAPAYPAPVTAPVRVRTSRSGGRGRGRGRGAASSPGGWQWEEGRAAGLPRQPYKKACCRCTRRGSPAWLFSAGRAPLTRPRRQKTAIAAFPRPTSGVSTRPPPLRARRPGRKRRKGGSASAATRAAESTSAVLSRLPPAAVIATSTGAPSPSPPSQHQPFPRDIHLQPRRQHLPPVHLGRGQRTQHRTLGHRPCHPVRASPRCLRPHLPLPPACHPTRLPHDHRAQHLPNYPLYGSRQVVCPPESSRSSAYHHSHGRHRHSLQQLMPTQVRSRYTGTASACCG